MPNHHHRAGSLKQSNKRNKRSKASKRSVSRATGGRVNVKTSSASNTSSKTKADRRHHLKQRRDASRLAVLQKKRGIVAGQVTPPRVIGIVSLSESFPQVEEKLLSLLVNKADQTHRNTTGVSVKYNVHKKQGNLAFLTCAKAFGNSTVDDDNDAAVMAALDLCRICDMILFVIDGDGVNPDAADPLGMNIGDGASTKSSSTHGQDLDHLISERGDRILAAVKGQGLPTPLTILARTVKDNQEDHMTMQSAKSVRRSAMKKHHDLKRYVSRFATTEFGAENDKVMDIDLTMFDDDEEEAMEEEEEGANVVVMDRQKQVESDALVRTLCTMSASPPKWVAEAPRAYLIADSQQYHAEKQELCLTGHVRGKVPFNVNSLIHVPNVGTFACKSLRKATPPLTRARSKGAVAMDEEEQVLLSDPRKRESLEIFATPDALEGEQNLVGFDDDILEEYEDDAKEEAVERPAGWSDYQSAWLDAVDDIGDGEDAFDHGELAKELNRKPSAGASVTTDAMDWDEDNEISTQEKEVLLAQRRKDQKEELEFPDEVEIDEETNARDRFARYRSLKSFRKSYWDPKENLPDSYGSIYHFSSFKATQRDVFADMKDVVAAANAAGDFWGHGKTEEESTEQLIEDGNEDDDEDLLDGCVPSGSYVEITLEGVASMPVSLDSTLVAVSLLPHENKVSVLHMGLCQTAKCDQVDAPVKSKDVLTFRCGWRTWKSRPVFSQNNLNSDKHKFERFLPQEGAFFAASAFGPVTYTPCPVLVFREDAPVETSAPSSRDLVAIGSIYGADADRIAVKRIILTGYPTRVHKRHATVKYMFYNPDDVRWFKPAGLSTKHGLHGHIVQSVGEHGTMKCLFNAPIKQHDTVMLPLYKRIFPKFAPASSGEKKTDLVIL